MKPMDGSTKTVRHDCLAGSYARLLAAMIWWPRFVKLNWAAAIGAKSSALPLDAIRHALLPGIAIAAYGMADGGAGSCGASLLRKCGRRNMCARCTQGV